MGINTHSFAFCVYTQKQTTSQCGAIQTIHFTQLGVIPTPNISICQKTNFYFVQDLDHEQVYPSLRRLKLNNKLNIQKTLFQLVQKALKNLEYMLYQIYYIIQVSVVYLINPAQLHPLLMAYLVRNVKLTTLENIYFKINFQVHYLKKINCSSQKKNRNIYIYIYY